MAAWQRQGLGILGVCRYRVGGRQTAINSSAHGQIATHGHASSNSGYFKSLLRGMQKQFYINIHWLAYARLG